MELFWINWIVPFFQNVESCFNRRKPAAAKTGEAFRNIVKFSAIGTLVTKDCKKSHDAENQLSKNREKEAGKEKGPERFKKKKNKQRKSSRVSVIWELQE